MDDDEELLRLFEIIGEASGRLTQRTRDALPHDWAGLRALRNVLAHQYGHVEADVLRDTATRLLPGLVELLEEQ